MEMKNIQLLAVYFADQITSANTIKNIFKNANADTNQLRADEFLSFTWDIETKYFTAAISVCCCPWQLFDRIKSDELEQVEAVLMIADLNDVNTIEKVQKMMLLIEENDTEICLLYTVEDIRNAHSKDAIMACCIENHFELVENNDCLEDDEDEDDALQEKFGVNRVIEALKSNVWNGHVLKSDGKSGKEISHENIDIDEMSESDLSFQELFGKFMLMKETAKTLGEDERKDYAEKVSLAFMDALGIDDGDGDDEDGQEPLR